MKSRSGPSPWRSTPMRLTVLLIAIFSVSSLTSFGIAYWVIRSNFDTILKAQVHQAIVSYETMSETEGLRERLVADAGATDPATMALVYVADDGTRIANVVTFPSIDGYTIVPEQAVTARGGEIADSYLALDARVGDGRLIVALTREQVIEMGEIFSTVFLVSLLPTLAIASVTGLLTAGRARDRIEGIRQVLGRLTDGNLSARAHVAGSGREDLDEIALDVNAMAQAQEAQVSSLKQISADIAHDLKTPIQRVAVHLDRLEKTSLDADQRMIVARALDETDRIVKTFQSLLQIAQIEGGHVRERFTPVSLRAIVEDMVDVFGPAAEESGHGLTLELSGPEAFGIAGDRQLLSQVLANLIENALRHVPAGGHVAVGLTRIAGRVELSVRDDGPGIPDHERGNVLRRLYRLERSRTSEGNGLGLALVAAICELHGAELALTDNVPGLAVVMTFPAPSKPSGKT
ncbi:signal transduction histidine kinase [Palleronia aestuarii]|uniref:histidine kinase n=1 Tax=Palleronia aestuarii TaxID=568105 RepID=A0A2W7MZI2_9RHOB|nr:HAMP domain-containing sensor histidine kinase [Palleronia aestuarii]PZX12993.1 signal transduction histidine kinase [Palleronia aestuarii]